MSRELPLDHDQHHERLPGADSVLTRHLSITLPATRWIVMALALVAATLLRLPGLNRWALTSEEGSLALTSWNLLLGEDVPSDLLGRPFLVEWVSLFTFLGHATDSVVRMSAVVAGVLLVGLVLLLGRWIGWLPAGATAILIAFSPTMIANSRRIDGGIVIALLVAAIIVLVFAGRRHTSLAWPAAIGGAAAMLLLSGPLGLAGLIVAAAGATLIARVDVARIRSASLTAGAAGFLITWAVLGSVFFTRPGTLISSTAEVFSQFFGDHLANIGDRFHMPLVNLIVNEPLLLVLALVGLFASHQRTLARSVAIWTLISLALISILGNTGIAGHTLVALPLALLAGLGVEYLLRAIPWALVRRGPASLFVAAFILLFLATLSLIGLLTPSGGLAGADWIARLVLVVLIVVIPLAVFISLLSPRISGHQLTLILTTGVLLFSLLTVRAAVLAASERPGEPTDPLAQGAISPSMAAVVNRIERVSIDLTRTQRTIQDPTGSHGLHIAIDKNIEQPLAWYFRDFPTVTTFDPAEDGPHQHAQVAFLSDGHDPAEVAPALRSEPYVFGHRSPEIFRDPDWGSLARSLVSISEWRHFWGYLVERTEINPADRLDMHLMVTPFIAERLYGPSGPFALGDVAGAGVEGGQFNSPRGLAIDEDGTTYVVDSGNQRIQVFAPDGEFLFAFGEPGEGDGQLGQLTTGEGDVGGIALHDDRVYVADTWNHRVQVFTTDGEFVTAWGGFFDAQDDPEANSTNPGLFYGPRGIAVSEDHVYVTDTGNERVQVFDLDGNIVALWGTAGSDDGQLLEPVGIAVHDGVVHVADSHNARISRFTTEGDFIDSWHVTEWEGLRFFEPYLTITPDGQVIATTSATGDIVLLNGPNESQPIQSGGVLRPFGVAVHPDGSSVLVTDGLRNGVLEITLP